MMAQGGYRLHGLKLSYFTGKLEAYLQAKGIGFEFVEMDTADFRRCGRATGFLQMPQLEAPDGSWLTDTTAIIRRFEADAPGPRLSPVTPLATFTSRLLEDAFDEWLWRPALYYRWAFEDDARLMSRQIARSMLRDVPGPVWLKARIVRARQVHEYLKRDGITPKTAPIVAAQLHDLIDLLEPVLARRPFLLGERPSEADFGLFGPVFRHFSIDPTPAAILRDRASNLLAWTTRLWALRPSDLEGLPEITTVPQDLRPLLGRIGESYLSYLAANALALSRGQGMVRYSDGGVAWTVPTSPYRGTCLQALQTDYLALSSKDQVWMTEALGGHRLEDMPQGHPPPPPMVGKVLTRHGL